jgi:hypothetical protein
MIVIHHERRRRCVVPVGHGLPISKGHKKNKKKIKKLHPNDYFVGGEMVTPKSFVIRDCRLLFYTIT